MVVYLLYILYTYIGISIVVICTSKYFFGRATWCKSKATLYGKTVIITGGNTGLGKATALDLARRGAKIIIASRNGEKAKETIDEINEKTGNKHIQYMHLDLRDLNSVRQFVKGFLQEESRLDILINNSGIANWSYNVLGNKTKQNYDIVFGVNHLGHFLLTFLLLDTLRKTGHSRIINVSSLVHLCRRNTFKYDKGPSADGVLYPDLAGYFSSKLANVMHMKILSKILKDTTVTANSVHPGIVYTDILTNVFDGRLPQWLCYIFNSILWLCFNTDTISGAQTTIFAAVDESLESVSGEYFGDCRYGKTNKLVNDENECQKLWDYSIEMCGLK